MTYRGRVKNGQITLDEPARLPEGAEVNVQVMEPGDGNGASPSRREILRMSPENRQHLLMQQAERLASHYAVDEDRSEWQGGDIVE